MFVSKYHMRTRWRLRLTKSLLNLRKTDILLDAGCGDGFISYVLSRNVKKVIGVDISKRTIAENNKFSDDKLAFMHLDLNTLSEKFSNSKFDKIICLDVLEHANNFKNIIDNFSKLLKKNGKLLMTIPVFEGHGHFKYNNLGFLEKFFRSKGFTIVHLKYMKEPFLIGIFNKFLVLLRGLVKASQREVDTFDETISATLRENKGYLFLLFSFYKPLFLLLLALTRFNIKPYAEGKEYLLILLIRSV